jgi:hypothetical protein
MVSIEFTHDELTLLRNALKSFMSDFGHKEHDVVSRLRELLHKVEPVVAE